ncbi:MAG: hypothetical protein ACI84E_002028, partial [Planctomycetota bacterium]
APHARSATPFASYLAWEERGSESSGRLTGDKRVYLRAV